MSVSIVAIPRRRFFSAERWNGHAAQVATGAASVRQNHCQYRNCQALAIDSTTTGAASSAPPISRSRSGSRSGTDGASGSGAGCASGGRRRLAVYPASSTVSMSFATGTDGGCETRACSIAKFTSAVTPSSALSAFSMCAEQAPQLIPPTSRTDDSTVVVLVMMRHSPSLVPMSAASGGVVRDRARDDEGDGDDRDEDGREHRQPQCGPGRCGHAPAPTNV